MKEAILDRRADMLTFSSISPSTLPPPPPSLATPLFPHSPPPFPFPPPPTHSFYPFPIEASPVNLGPS